MNTTRKAAASEIRTEDEFKKFLLEKGIVTEIKPPLPLDDEDDWDPIPIEGRPISEEIIEDRR